MAVKKGLIFNTNNFLRDFVKLTTKTYPKSAEKGMLAAMKQLKLDADNRFPQTPHDKGDLKDSGKPDAEIRGLKITGTVTYDAKYAAYQHAGKRKDGSRVVENYKNPRAGKKFLSQKLILFPGRYMNIITKKIRKVLGF